MTATQLPTGRKRLRFGLMETLGFIDTPTVAGGNPATAPGPMEPIAATRLVTRGRHLATTGELVRDLWDTTDLDAPSLADWAPGREGMDRLLGGDVPWKTLAGVGVIILALGLAGYLWLAGWGDEAQRSTAAIGPLVEELAVAIDPARVTSAGESPLAASEVDRGRYLQVEEPARALFQAVAALPSDDPRRDSLTRAAETALEAVRRARVADAVETAVAPVLVLPPLQADPALTDVPAAAEDFVAWRSNLESVFAALPTSAVEETRRAGEALLNEVETLQRGYLEALGRGDQAWAGEWLNRVEARLGRVRERLDLELAEERAVIVTLFDQAASALGG